MTIELCMDCTNNKSKGGNTIQYEGIKSKTTHQRYKNSSIARNCSGF